MSDVVCPTEQDLICAQEPPLHLGAINPRASSAQWTGRAHADVYISFPLARSLCPPARELDSERFRACICD